MAILSTETKDIGAYNAGSAAEVTVTGTLPVGYTYYILVSVTTGAGTYYSEYIEYDATTTAVTLDASNAKFFVAITEIDATITATNAYACYK